MAQIPRRDFGKTGVLIPAIGMGGRHLASVHDKKDRRALVARSVDGDVTFFDNC